MDKTKKCHLHNEMSIDDKKKILLDLDKLSRNHSNLVSQTSMNFLENYKEFTVCNSNGKYVISVKDDILANTANADKIEVFAVATADRTLLGTRGEEVFVTDTKTEVVRSIEILPSNDSTAPTFMMGTTTNVDEVKVPL